MAPRKRTSSGGKKQGQQNPEALPSQPSKFGIQHYFERHSQSQKVPLQSVSERLDGDRPGSVTATLVRKQLVDVDCAGIGAESHGVVNNLERTESVSRGESPRSGVVNSVTVNGTCDTILLAGRNVVPVPECPNVNGKIDRDLTNSRSNGRLLNVEDDKGDENLLPVIVDPEDNQLEVSPEASKSNSIKRFKFSPGMLIKMSQDDVVDEVTWKISPVNEKLRAISKNPNGGVRILADSTRFNSMSQCSLRKVVTSPGVLKKQTSWLPSHPRPQTADETSLRFSEGPYLKQLRSGDVMCPHGISGSNNNTSEAANTQSPFTTPPSLSCCHEKGVQKPGSMGALDQRGSTHHKKALIELLDQVEDMISVEQSQCNDKTPLDGETGLKADAFIGKFENEELGDSMPSFLVLEVSDSHENIKSSGVRSFCKVLRLLDEQTGTERVLQLWDQWYASSIAPGDTVSLIGEFDAQGIFDVNDQKNFVILHPDILVSGSRVSASFSCPRRTVLDERLKQGEHSVAALMGTILHQIFQAALMSESPTKEFLEEYARMASHKCLESLYACEVSESDIWKTLMESIPKILNWISDFRDHNNPNCPSIVFNSGESSKKIKVSEVIDIEEMAWAPKYGLKGMIDASLCVKTSDDSAEACAKIMPLEFKTGKGNSGLVAIEHGAQVMLYTLLMSERYKINVDQGLLYYLHTDQTQGISVGRSDLVGLVMRRNELANDLLTASRTQQLPPMLQRLSMCRSCRQLNACSVYHKAHGGDAEGSGLGDIYESLVSHITNAHTAFLRQWEKLIDLEAKHMESVKKENWLSDKSKNDEQTSCLSSLHLENLDLSAKGSCKGDRFVYRFLREHAFLSEVQADKNCLSSSFSGCKLRVGDHVIVSIAPGNVQVANGIIADMDNDSISVSFAKKLRLPGKHSGSTAEDIHKQRWRIDREEPTSTFAIMRYNLIQLFFSDDRSTRMRNMVVDLEIPKFDSGISISQDPALSYISSEKSLNDDQRRAIIKILTARDYALILGMPGTGKTSMLVHAVKVLLMRGASILLTSYTNSAVDNLLIKLKTQGIDFIRIGRPEVVHEEIQEKCLSASGMASTHEIKEKFDSVKVVAVTCLGITSPLLANKSFDVCIMDEAGQITLPVSLGPLMLASKFILVGDHYQLPPLVQSPEARENGMGVSLFCRLSEAHPHAIAALHYQYRMCAAIMHLSNTLIYGNRLQCGSPEIENAKLAYRHPVAFPAWLTEVLDPDHPVIFINTDLLPAFESHGQKGLNNPLEANIIVEVTKALLSRGIEEKDIGIITPYNSQADLIQGDVSSSVEIHTIDKYQGRDKDCILVSFVRSREHPRSNASSLLGDWHRINVALTRAKKKLIMVGCCRTLSQVPLLKLLIQEVKALSGLLDVSVNDIGYQVPPLKRCMLHMNRSLSL